MSKLGFKYGAMNSGKSTALINTAYNYTERGLGVLVAKPSIDTKGEALVVARAGLERPVDVLVTPEMNLRDEINEFHRPRFEELGGLACLLVDEAQFLQPEQVDQLLEIAKLDETSVIAYGLRTDFRTQMFPGSQRLLELADSFEKLPTMCRCKSQAEFNTRLVNGNFVFEGDQVAIDGEGTVEYESLCGVCYLTEKAKSIAS